MKKFVTRTSASIPNRHRRHRRRDDDDDDMFIDDDPFVVVSSISSLFLFTTIIISILVGSTSSYQPLLPLPLSNPSIITNRRMMSHISTTTTTTTKKNDNMKLFVGDRNVQQQQQYREEHTIQLDTSSSSSSVCGGDAGGEVQETTLISRTVTITPLVEEAEAEEHSVSSISHRNNKNDNDAAAAEDDGSPWYITVWEWKNPSTMVQDYWDRTNQQEQEEEQIDDCSNDVERSSSSSSSKSSLLLDPFGLVSWPGSIRAAQKLRHRQKHVVKNRTVLVLGCGVGVEVQAAIMCGAHHVIATDIHPTTIQQTIYGVQQLLMLLKSSLSTSSSEKEDKEQQTQQQQLQELLTTQILDICASSSQQPLPNGFDTVVIADVLYNEELATHVRRRIIEAISINPNCHILITDSQRFVPTFLPMLNEELRDVWKKNQRQKQQQQQRLLEDITTQEYSDDDDNNSNVDPPNIKPYSPLSWTIQSQKKERDASGVWELDDVHNQLKDANFRPKKWTKYPGIYYGYCHHIFSSIWCNH